MDRFKDTCRHFNSQPHEEADVAVTARVDLANISTHSLTKRLTDYQDIAEATLYNFNSQPHEEADYYSSYL